MGSIIGGIGSAIGGMASANAAKDAAKIQAAAADRAGERALTGYRYLTEGAGAAPMNNYIQTGQRALNNQSTTQNLMMDLLGVTGYGAGQRTQPINALGANGAIYAPPSAPGAGQTVPQIVQPRGNAFATAPYSAK